VPDLPLLVFGPRSTSYDFGPSHPLTPRRFGPGIDLLRALGAEPGLAPEPASDEDLLLCHTARYVHVVKRFSEADLDPWAESEAGIGPGDDPPFHGMHEAGAAVAGGSLRAMDAILRGDVRHAFHPGGGLHHAMPSRAAGFCIYNDVALAIARARQEGLRVLYIDLDVHHGDGVEVIHAGDPGVMTVSMHESGRYLFPGTGFAWEIGEGEAAGSVVNIPIEPGTSEHTWLHAVTTVLPDLAAAFGPDIVVSQHGCDTHPTDPLAHLDVTTTSMGHAARVVDRIAHTFAGGRWLATGGGGYGVYRVVPRAWGHVWLAGAHRDPPDRIPEGWRERWAAEAARYGVPDLPRQLDDAPIGGMDGAADAASRQTIAAVRESLVPRLIQAADASGAWGPLDSGQADEDRMSAADPVAVPDARPTVVDAPSLETLERLRFAPRLIANLSSAQAKALVTSCPMELTLAVADDVVVGLVSSARRLDGPRELDGVWVVRQARRRGLAGDLLRRHLATSFPSPPGTPRTWLATVSVGERDPVEPLDHALRMSIARRLLERAGFQVDGTPDRLAAVDRSAISASTSTSTP
jgi:acetoin utilization protein AcuC